MDEIKIDGFAHSQRQISPQNLRTNANQDSNTLKETDTKYHKQRQRTVHTYSKQQIQSIKIINKGTQIKAQ